MTSLLEEHNNTYTVGLRFPLSTSFESDKKVFIMDYNTATKSDFLKHLLKNKGSEESEESEESIEKEHYYEFVIPELLYEGVRYIDIAHFIQLWKGDERFFTHNGDKYSFKSIAKVTQSLLLSDDLDFVRSLEILYPPCSHQEE